MPRLTRRALLGASLASAAAGRARESHAREARATPYVLPRTQCHALVAESNGIAYTLYVRVPASYADDAGRDYPVVLTLDADYQFAIAANHLEHLADRNAQGPDAILVSIAYAGAYPDRERYRAHRTRDYTPVHWPTGGYGPAFQRASGGGPKFLQFVEREVLPFVQARFRARADDCTIVGHSYGGLFATWVLLERPALFRRYLVVSPSLWYADRLMLRRAAEPALARRVLERPVRVWLAVGEHEEQPASGQLMVSQARELHRAVAAWRDPNVRCGIRVFEDETHASVFPAAFSTGIRHLFRGG